MPRDLDFAGESGNLYRYQLHTDDRPTSPAGGNYLYVREDASGALTVVYAGETESLYRGWDQGWAEARKTHKANAVYVRLNVTGHVRRAEQADIIGRHKPVMNKVAADGN